MPKRFRPHLLIAIALAMTLALLSQPAIHQPLAYHRFADTRTLLGLPNFWNVASNLMRSRSSANIQPQEAVTD